MENLDALGAIPLYSVEVRGRYHYGVCARCKKEYKFMARKPAEDAVSKHAKGCKPASIARSNDPDTAWIEDYTHKTVAVRKQGARQIKVREYVCLWCGNILNGEAERARRNMQAHVMMKHYGRQLTITSIETIEPIDYDKEPPF